MRMDHAISTAKAGDVFVAPSQPEIAFMAVQNPFVDRLEWIRFKNLPAISDSIVDAPAVFTAKDFRRDDYEVKS